MITGQTYQEVKSAFTDRDWVSEAGGVPAELAAPAYLSEFGFAFAPKYQHHSYFKKALDVWPAEPFADIHICKVMGSRSHAVLMLRDGTVLDPNCEKPRRLSDYVRVDMIAGVIPLYRT